VAGPQHDGSVNRSVHITLLECLKAASVMGIFAAALFLRTTCSYFSLAELQFRTMFQVYMHQ